MIMSITICFVLWLQHICPWNVIFGAKCQFQ